MKDFQQRAFEEQQELAKRLGKLAEFNRGEVFKSLDFAEQLRLQMQEHAMYLYLHILAERIANFEEDNPQISQISADLQKEKP
jgi:hypothetical protein